MISDGNHNGNGHGSRRGSLYSGYNPIVDAVCDRNAALDTEELFDVTDEIAVKQARVVEWLKVEKAARDAAAKGDKDPSAAMAVGTQTDKAVDGVLKAKQIGAAINSAGTVWNDYKAKRFVQRIIGVLEASLFEQPTLLAQLMDQLEGVRRSFAGVEGSHYTPDQDLHLMDDTIPSR